MPKPGLLSPKWERQLYSIISTAGGADALRQLAESNSAGRPTIALFEGLRAYAAGDIDRAKTVLEWLRTNSYSPETDPFVRRYAAQAVVTLAITDAITVRLSLDANALGLALAEIEQTQGNLDAAISIVEGLEPTSVAAVSLAELYAQRGSWQDVISLTEGIVNDDDATMYLLIERGVAFTASGYSEAARVALKEALRPRSRSDELRRLAYVERGNSYLAEGKKTMARKDFEKVLGEKSDYPGLRELLARASDG